MEFKGGQLEIISRNDIYEIDKAAIDLLEHVGMIVYSSKVREIFKENGAEVDEKTQLEPRELQVRQNLLAMDGSLLLD